MVVAGDVQSTTRSRGSTNSRTSKSSKSHIRRSKSWYCCSCCCKQKDRGETADLTGVVWPAPARFYCCRADLVADMARERASIKHKEHNQTTSSMEEDDDGDLDEVAEEALPDDTFREVFDRSHLGDGDERWEITHPDVPYVENLPRQLDSGRAIVITGYVPEDAERFSVNLTCGVGNEPDIAFHFNPRFDRKYVARNSRVKGTWGEEEGAALGGNPFTCGKRFVMHIVVTATSFKVSVDHMHFCSFQFRMPLSKVCRLEIHGDVSVSSVRHTRLEVYPERSVSTLSEHTFVTIPTNHAVPWEMNLPNTENLLIGKFEPNLSPGKEITIKGRIKLLPHALYVNLQQGSQLWPHPNVHFHLNPRFAAEDSEHVVVANTWMQGSWGSEQRYSRCRFKPGHPFSMTIYVEDQRYRVMVNGLQQAALIHRAPPSFVDTLIIRGDLFINYIGFAQSAPAPERLPSPSSRPPSLAGSLTDYHMETPANLTDSLKALSPGSQSSFCEVEVDNGFMITGEENSHTRERSKTDGSTSGSSLATLPADLKEHALDISFPSKLSSNSSSSGTGSITASTPVSSPKPSHVEKAFDSAVDLEKEDNKNDVSI